MRRWGNREWERAERERRIAALERELGLDLREPWRPPGREWHEGDPVAPWEQVVHVLGKGSYVVQA